MDIKKFFKNKEVNNASWLIGGRVVQMGLSFVVGILTARYLGPSNYGLINYGTAYVSFFTALCVLGLNSVIVKDFVDYPNDQGQTIGTAIFLRLIASILSVITIILIVSVVDRNEPLTIMVVALCSFGLIFHVFETFNFWFQAQYRSKITAMATLIAYVAMSIYKIILLAFGMDVRWFAFALSIDYIVIAIILFSAYRKYKGPKLTFSKVKAKSLLNVSYHYILSSMMVAIYGQTDKFMLKQMLDESAVGYYSIATALASIWTFVLQAIIDSMYPTIMRLKKEDNERYERKNRQLYAIVFWVSCFVSLMFMLFGKLAIGILYGKEYLPAVNILLLVTWYTAFSYLGVARNAWIVSEGKQKYLKYMYGGAAVLNVILNYILIPICGGFGAALASLLTQMCTSIGLPMLIKELRPNARLMLEAIALKKIR